MTSHRQLFGKYPVYQCRAAGVHSVRKRVYRPYYLIGQYKTAINVTLTDEKIQQLIDLVRSLEKLDISGLTDTINSVGDWFKSVGEAISDFFKSIGEWFASLFS